MSNRTQLTTKCGFDRINGRLSKTVVNAKIPLDRRKKLVIQGWMANPQSIRSQTSPNTIEKPTGQHYLEMISATEQQTLKVPILHGLARPDVAKAHGQELFNVGFYMEIPAKFLIPGNYKLKLQFDSPEHTTSCKHTINIRLH